MSRYFTTESEKNAIPLQLIPTKTYDTFVKDQNDTTRNLMTLNKFTAKPGQLCLITNEQGELARVLVGVKDFEDRWAIGDLPYVLPDATYAIESDITLYQHEQFSIVWGLGCYRFTKYKKSDRTPSQLHLKEGLDHELLNEIVDALCWVRDLINTPNGDMHPETLAKEAELLGERFGAHVQEIVGDDLLKENYPLIHAVGRSSQHAPRLIDIRWGDANHPKITLVGKGVCFDSGGYDMKSARGMALMKKDMGGAAHVLGLAHLIMRHKLPINLRVLIPAVENLVSSNAYIPGDVYTARSGKTVEITNTDAEGRIVMADAITAAIEEKPDLLIVMATLTGAARIAMGTDIAAMFTPDDKLADELVQHGEKVHDHVWRLPLFKPYLKALDSHIADIKNSADTGYGGATVAALFLQEFIGEDTPFVHFDIMAYNNVHRAARPKGGEAMAIRAIYHYLVEKYPQT